MKTVIMSRLPLSAMVLSTLLFTLASCGFQLRGQARLPEALSLVQMELGDTQNLELSQPVQQRLGELLRINGASISDQASTRIILSEAILRRHTLATGARGDAREFTLNLSIVVRVLDDTGAELMPATPLNVVRSLLYRESELLGQLEGEKLALRELIDELANTILRRLQRL